MLNRVRRATTSTFISTKLVKLANVGTREGSPFTQNCQLRLLYVARSGGGQALAQANRSQSNHENLGDGPPHRPGPGTKHRAGDE